MRKFRSVISLFVLVFFIFSLGGCSGAKNASLRSLSVDKVKDILEKKLRAEEYDYTRNGGKFTESDFSYFRDGYYITSEGDKGISDSIKNFSSTYPGSMLPHNYTEVGMLNKIFKESGTDFVVYKTSDRTDDEQLKRSTGSLARSTIMIYAEFNSTEDALNCFDNMIKHYFSKSATETYESRLKYMDSMIERCKGTIMGDWLNTAAKDQKAVHLEDLDESVYSRTDNNAHLDYSIRWDITRWGDYAMKDPDDQALIEEHALHTSGIRAHHLCVEGNKLLYIEGVDLTSNKGGLDHVNRLCKALSTGNPFDAKMSDDLKYQLAFILSIWSPAHSRVDDI